MPWILLAVAGVLEIVWAYAMKQSEGMTRPMPTLVMGVAMLASLAFLAIAMRSLPLGTAYVIWTGIGAVGSFVLGIWLLGEPASAMRVTAAVLITVGIVLLKIAG